MITIDCKSTGTLLNEYITANLKYKYIGPKPAFKERITDLNNALLARNIEVNVVDTRFNKVQGQFLILEKVLEDLWQAVEDTIKLRNISEDDTEAVKKAGYAALKAFELNATRCDIIREMDEILGESSVTFLEKSY